MPSSSFPDRSLIGNFIPRGAAAWLRGWGVFETYLKSQRNIPAKMADACRDFIAEDSEDPFFLYFCTTQPHRPFHRQGADPVSLDDVIVPP